VEPDDSSFAGDTVVDLFAEAVDRNLASSSWEVGAC